MNAHMDSGELARHVVLDDRGARMLGAACRSGLLSGRGRDRVLRVARTIADLNQRESVRSRDVGSALALRPDIGMRGWRAA